MAQIVRMPAVMANATDAVLSVWLAEPGTKIAVGDPLAEIETDKAVVEYAAEAEGIIGRFLVAPGTRVAVGDPIVVLLEEGEDASSIHDNGGAADDPAHAADDPAHAADDPAQSVSRHSSASDSSASDSSASPAAAAQSPGPQTRRHAAAPTSDRPTPDRLFVTPIARRIAEQRGIKLTALTGTGPNGRIVRRDVEAYAAAPAVKAGSAEGAASAPGYTDVPLSGMRRAIAERLTESKATVPHFYVTASLRVERLLALRLEANRSSSRKLSINDFVVKAVAGALVEVPAANAIWHGDCIRQFDGVDIAVAVAVPNGLLTPVLRGVEQLGLVELSAQIAELAATARSGRLQQHQLEGGSFSVSSLGMHGVEHFSAIINPPQAGILAVGAAKQQPVVDAEGRLAVGTVMTVTLSADHRVIDGAVAAEWMAAFVRRMENPISLLL